MTLTEKILITGLGLSLALILILYLPLGFLMLLDGHAIMGMFLISYWIFIAYECIETYIETKDK